MSSVKITAIPPGFAPPHIREQWVGIVIPLATEEDFKERPPSGVKIGNENDGGYVVLREKAVQALIDAGKDDAADFWDNVPIISLASYLEFRRDVCELVE